MDETHRLALPLVSLKLGGVRGRAPPQRVSAKRSRSNLSTKFLFGTSSNFSQSSTDGLGSRMPVKPCSRCSRPAVFSLAFLLSTLQVRPRKQKCTQTILLCQACIHDAITALRLQPLDNLQQPLRNAYTAISGHSRSESDPHNAALAKEEDHHGDRNGVSYRPCLIAGNSRIPYADEDSGDR